MTKRRLNRKPQKGFTLLVVLVLLTLLLLAVLSFARITLSTNEVTANIGYKKQGVQASEAGLSAAKQFIQALTAGDTPQAGYYPRQQITDEAGIPSVNWSVAPSLQVGAYTVKYVIERLCTGSSDTISDAYNSCTLDKGTTLSSMKVDSADIDPPLVKQYRITVMTTGPKSAVSWIQALVAKGEL